MRNFEKSLRIIKKTRKIKQWKGNKKKKKGAKVKAKAKAKWKEEKKKKKRKSKIVWEKN